jgi:5-methyltetrahydropteroyltriglutamate--homocysteine methyltransferase
MGTLVDDIGSFPLPNSVNRESFNKAYQIARNAMAHGKEFSTDEFVKKNFLDITLDSFKKKLRAGLDIVNYPQQYNGMDQIGDPINKAMEDGTFVVDESEAFLPEVYLIDREAKRLFEEFGKIILLRVSLFGPMEHYLNRIGHFYFKNEGENFAETVRRFAKASILNSKYVKTAVVSIDEPSFGFSNIEANRDEVCDILEKAFDFQGVIKQIHLHSSSRLPDLLSLKNIDVLSFEYAASPKNIEGISKGLLDQYDKQIRVGVSRTDIDSILAELYEKGVAKPSAEQLVESEDTIRKRYKFAKEKYGDRMTFTGPDCGLGGWPSQEAAQLLLERTVKAVKATPTS